jgi:hypothetical protein
MKPIKIERLIKAMTPDWKSGDLAASSILFAPLREI